MSPAAVCCGFIFVSLYNVYLLTNYTHIPMRTNIVIDDKLMAEALKATGLRTKKEAVEEGLKLLVKRNKQQAIRKLRGKLHWEGDLEELRGGK
ncbi:type II toxin-antitoxin system VapB family antitoxin [Nitrosococcus watsonii]|uniref:type II toxin-antitoxin system VapB family antitoxin n=1 Tax=Nitrosococcus watsonii TaxID=473531 RepID=UPI001E3065CF|nr:type II toxin-antitoxin system VapB family antitoxin [Nitrosococcus watsonii]